MYKELLEALKTKFQGVSENILQRQAQKLAKTATTVEQVKTAVDGVSLQQLIDSYADSRANEAQQTAVHNYEAKYGLKEGKPITSTEQGGDTVAKPQTTTETQPTGGADSQTNALLQQLIKQNEQLTERLNRMDGERTTTARKQQLSAVTSKLPEALRKGYDRISVDSLTDEQFSALVTEVTTEVDGIVKDTQQRGAVFGRPAAQNGNTQQGELSKEQQEAIAHRDTTPKSDQQPF